METLPYRPREMALTLMASALDLLLACGDATAAEHLRVAIGAADGGLRGTDGDRKARDERSGDG